MEGKKTILVVFLAMLASIVSSRSAPAATIIPIVGDAGWGEANEYYVDISGVSLIFSMYTCDAPETQVWQGPSTVTVHSIGYCTAGSASYGSNSRVTIYNGPGQFDTAVTGTPGKCGPVMINPDNNFLWSETCAASISGSFDAQNWYPGQAPGPLLSGTLTGMGTVTFTGFMPTGGFYLDLFGYDMSFNGTADITDPVDLVYPTDPAPEPGSLPLLVMGMAALLALKLRRTATHCAARRAGRRRAKPVVPLPAGGFANPFRVMYSLVRLRIQ